jgi:hypothetical protein
MKDPEWICPVFCRPWEVFWAEAAQLSSSRLLSSIEARATQRFPDPRTLNLITEQLRMIRHPVCDICTVCDGR